MWQQIETIASQRRAAALAACATLATAGREPARIAAGLVENPALLKGVRVAVAEELFQSLARKGFTKQLEEMLEKPGFPANLKKPLCNALFEAVA